jgi:hypothetical protein
MSAAAMRGLRKEHVFWRQPLRKRRRHPRRHSSKASRRSPRAETFGPALCTCAGRPHPLQLPPSHGPVLLFQKARDWWRRRMADDPRHSGSAPRHALVSSITRWRSLKSLYGPMRRRWRWRTASSRLRVGFDEVKPRRVLTVDRDLNVLHGQGKGWMSPGVVTAISG